MNKPKVVKNPPKFIARAVKMSSDTRTEVQPAYNGAYAGPDGVRIGGNLGHDTVDVATDEAVRMNREGDEVTAVYKLVRIVRRTEPPIKIENVK